MYLELDHLFILTDRPEEAGDLLVAMGLRESFSRDHQGQGTSNRRFEFANGMLELLYVRDANECHSGPAKNLRFPDRVQMEHASPFGVVLTRLDEDALGMPFSGWSYQPDYFSPPSAFHVGANSDLLEEPLCIYVPFVGKVRRTEETGMFQTLSHVQLCVPNEKISDTLNALATAKRLHIEHGREHLVVVTLDNGNLGLTKDFRPALPLIINW